MWIYAGFDVGAWIFVFRKMSELTGRSLEQIEGSLRGGKFSPADFKNIPPRAEGTPVAAVG